MGGLGSGKGLRRKAWRSNKLKTSSLPGLKIQELIKLHNANPNSTLTFNDIKLMVADDGSAVHVKGADANKLSASAIKISTVPCNYGGFRHFGHCPTCQKRVKTLYLHREVFACRHCLQMGYQSQNATCSYRLLTKQRAVGQKINNDEWTKPKWMRSKTFARLRNEYFDLNEKEQIAGFFSLRNNRAVDKIFDEYGSAIIAAEVWEMQRFGGGVCYHGLLPFYDYFLREAQLEDRINTRPHN